MVNKDMDTVRSTDLGLLALYGKKAIISVCCVIYWGFAENTYIYIEELGISEGNYVTI
jgi:hypothetical protein